MTDTPSSDLERARELCNKWVGDAMVVNGVLVDIHGAVEHLALNIALASLSTTNDRIEEARREEREAIAAMVERNPMSCLECGAVFDPAERHPDNDCPRPSWDLASNDAIASAIRDRGG